MYGIYAYIDPPNHSNVGIYGIVWDITPWDCHRYVPTLIPQTTGTDRHTKRGYQSVVLVDRLFQIGGQKPTSGEP